MKYLYGACLLVACMCYVSSCFYVMTGGNDEIENYCNGEAMAGESKHSQRNIACKLRKHR